MKKFAEVICLWPPENFDIGLEGSRGRFASVAGSEVGKVRVKLEALLGRPVVAHHILWNVM